MFLGVEVGHVTSNRGGLTLLSGGILVHQVHQVLTVLLGDLP